MAAGIMPEPGSKYGPCVNECEHSACNVTKKRAALICHHCDKPIGYDTRFYDVGVPGKWSCVHALCEEIAIENEQKEKAK